MKAVAQRLRYSKRSIRRHFPTLCSAISVRYLNHRNQIRMERVEQCCCTFADYMSQTRDRFRLVKTNWKAYLQFILEIFTRKATFANIRTFWVVKSYFANWVSFFFESSFRKLSVVFLSMAIALLDYLRESPIPVLYYWQATLSSFCWFIGKASTD